MSIHIGTALFERIWQHKLTQKTAQRLFTEMVPTHLIDEVKEHIQYDFLNEYLDEKNISVKPIKVWVDELLFHLVDFDTDGLVQEDDDEIYQIFCAIVRKCSK
jgi:hypothetical protein